jgi:predicted N-acyltransferase
VTLNVQIAHSVEEVGQEAWDRLSGGRPFASYRWYRYGETVLVNDAPIYIILSYRGEPVARGTFWLRRKEQLPISSKVVRRFMERVLHCWPLLICQSPLLEASGLILPEDSRLRDEAVGIIAQVAQEQVQRHRGSFLIYDYLEKPVTKHATWPSAFRTIEFQAPGTYLTVKWPDFESYYEHLSKSTRAQYRRNRNRAADLGIKVSRHRMKGSLDEDTLDEAVELIWSVDQHHNSTPTPWAWRMLKYAYMVNATWLRTEIDGQMVGCFIVLGDGDTRKMTLMGRDYDVRYAYFQLIYEAIRCAIEEGVQVLWGGSGVYDMKQKLGFETANNNHTIFAGVLPPLQLLGRIIATTEKEEIK